jgi:hypothetical protein
MDIVCDVQKSSCYMHLVAICQHVHAVNINLPVILHLIPASVALICVELVGKSMRLFCSVCSELWLPRSLRRFVALVADLVHCCSSLCKHALLLFKCTLQIG